MEIKFDQVEVVKFLSLAFVISICFAFSDISLILIFLGGI